MESLETLQPGKTPEKIIKGWGCKICSREWVRPLTKDGVPAKCPDHPEAGLLKPILDELPPES